MVQNIVVGDAPTFIQSVADHVYVANYASNAVSVINPDNGFCGKQNITVGEGPNWIYSSGTDVYVANTESDTVSLIDRVTLDVVAGVRFDVSPGRTGQIV